MKRISEASGRQSAARRAAIGWLTAMVAMAIAGCAAGPEFPSLKPSASAAHATASWPAWDQCLRDHGVSVPAGYVPGVGGVPKPDANIKVIKECQKYQPPAQMPPLSVRKEVIAASKCMETHGFQNTYQFFPGGEGITYAAGITPSTPGFAAALKACGRFAGP